MNFLNDIEKNCLQRFVEDTTTYNAVKKVILQHIYFQGTLKEGESPDYEKNWLYSLGLQDGVLHDFLGKDLKARVYALQLLKEGYTELEKFRKVEEIKKDNKNEAR